ncbi:MAG TPA: hypothetical protein VGL09_16435 [Methylomirabilota bacterium]|jgi:hypothetical protein
MPGNPDWQAVVGLVLSLVGAILLSTSPMRARGQFHLERDLYGDPRTSGPLMVGVRHEVGSLWWSGWFAMTLGFAFQALSAYGTRLTMLFGN